MLCFPLDCHGHEIIIGSICRTAAAENQHPLRAGPRYLHGEAEDDVGLTAPADIELRNRLPGEIWFARMPRFPLTRVAQRGRIVGVRGRRIRDDAVMQGQVGLEQRISMSERTGLAIGVSSSFRGIIGDGKQS